MIAIIRIAGDVKIREEIRETFRRLGLKRKYSCIVIENPTKVELGMLKEINNFVAFGEIDDKTFKELIEKRGKKFNKDIKSKFSKETRQVFRLHPPRKGIDSKLPFGIKKGVLGNHKKDINKLIERML